MRPLDRMIQPVGVEVTVTCSLPTWAPWMKIEKLASGDGVGSGNLLAGGGGRPP